MTAEYEFDVLEELLPKADELRTAVGLLLRAETERQDAEAVTYVNQVVTEIEEAVARLRAVLNNKKG